MRVPVQIPRLPVGRPTARVALLLTVAVPVGGIAASSASARSTKSVNAGGTVKYVKRDAKRKIVEQSGTVTGRPFGKGTLKLRSKLAGRKKLEFSIRLKTSRGTVWGHGTASLSVSGSRSKFTGTVRIDRGSGAYRKITRRTLKVTGSGDDSARSTKVRFTGRVRY
ncbi:MAG: hypothetical protein M0P31_12315 [Solirubrobacteraceae bacterium]|nr:hypothetical protein [Solirubrobacteraceae bacterium]